MGCAPAGPARKVCLPPTPQRCQAKRSGAFRGPPARPAGSVGAVRRQLRDMHAVPTWRLSMMAKASGACSKDRRWLTPTATSPAPYRRATSSRLLLQRAASSGQAPGIGRKHARSEFSRRRAGAGIAITLWASQATSGWCSQHGGLRVPEQRKQSSEQQTLQQRGREEGAGTCLNTRGLWCW